MGNIPRKSIMLLIWQMHFRQENHCSTLNSHSYYALLPKGIDNKLRITNIVAHNRNSYYTLSPKGFANKLRITNSEVNILCMNE